MPLPSLVPLSRCEQLMVTMASGFFWKKNSPMVRRDFFRAVPETFAMVDGR